MHEWLLIQKKKNQGGSEKERGSTLNVTSRAIRMLIQLGGKLPEGEG